MVYLKDTDIIQMKQHQLYWLELWEELLNQFTIDEYKTPVKNLYWLLEDLRDSKVKAEENRMFNEIKNSEIGLEKDETARDCNNSLNNLFSDKKEGAKEGAIEKIKNMKYLEENEYFEKVAFNLYEILSSENEENIEKLTILTKIFIAHLINRKYSSYYLQTRPFLFTNGCFKGANFQFRLNYLFSYLLKDKDKWSVLFKVTLKKEVLNIRKHQDLKFLSNEDENIKNDIQKFQNILTKRQAEFKLEQDKLKRKIKTISDSIRCLKQSNSFYVHEEAKYLENELNTKDKEDIYENDSSVIADISKLKKFQFENNSKNLKNDIQKIEKKINFLKKSDGKIFIEINNIEAPDPYSISKIAKNKLLRFMHSVRYNSPNISFSVMNIDSNVLIKNQNISILVAKEKSFDYRKKLKFRGDEINRHFNYIDKCKSEYLKDDFQDVMHFYGMFLDGQYDSEKFLSLWIALERLCDISQGGKGSTVAKDVSSMVTLSHLKKVLINLWHDLDRLGLSDILIEKFSISIENNKVKEEELFFLIKDEYEEIRDLVEEKSNSKLIYERIRSLSQKFKTANDLQKYISDYKTSVENSLWRLYSIRNRITHEAYIDSDLSLHLIQLDYFFKITYNNLLFALTLKRFNSRRDIFEMYKDRYIEVWEYQKGLYTIFDNKKELKDMILEPFSIYK